MIEVWSSGRWKATSNIRRSRKEAAALLAFLNTKSPGIDRQIRAYAPRPE